MSRSESLAGYLREQARRKLDRVEVRDRGRNARSALALLDATAYVETLADDDPFLEALAAAGRFGPHGFGDFQPGDGIAKLVRFWETGEPRQLLAAMAAALHGSPV
ncbi:hypothetical protein GCM10010156_27600 [Planobispora rosea]|uniref:Uncharacterized protein n=1 Tax=Planobispora rosea TaxID=35762 RepID=A0A8J3RXZ6_PLARO|nr:hypothetical protein [Planobispora rosea]GGS67155.1 hypothetical protein GCM10010156_27600 [Planobispora rosea]GIH85121.1 hypothetical protein Pro02_35290 [Planobispora rosea]